MKRYLTITLISYIAVFSIFITLPAEGSILCGIKELSQGMQNNDRELQEEPKSKQDSYTPDEMLITLEIK